MSRLHEIKMMHVEMELLKRDHEMRLATMQSVIDQLRATNRALEKQNKKLQMTVQVNSQANSVEWLDWYTDPKREEYRAEHPGTERERLILL